jgi:hypothetical protein
VDARSDAGGGGFDGNAGRDSGLDGAGDQGPETEGDLPRPPLTPAEAGEPLPRYAAISPEPFRWAYRLRRGHQQGQGELAYERNAQGQFELRLQAQWAVPARPGRGAAGLQTDGPAGQATLELSSTGHIGAQGLEPQRYADRRRAPWGRGGGGTRAVHFDAAAGLIRFSGPQWTYPLPPAAQDRLSWLLQLPAVLLAEPRLRAAGARVSLFVAGPRGDAQAWHFESQGPEMLDLEGGPGPMPAVRYSRTPARPYDTQVEVWLDPARQFLPLRWRLSHPPGADTAEWSLSSLPAPARP